MASDQLELSETADVDVYAAAVTAFLEREPVQRNVLLTVIGQAQRGWAAWTGPPHFWWLTSDEAVVAAASWTPPFPLLVSSMPDEGGALIADSALTHAGETGTRLSGVTGPRESAWTVARVLAARLHADVVPRFRMIVHELRTVRDVADPGGAGRVADPADAGLVHEWMRAFNVEIDAGHYPEATVQTMLALGRVWLWVHARAPRSIATVIPPAGGVARIGGVYTPPQWRGQGYARRLVHQASDAALREPGVVACTLNTDASNPVSNSIYRQIGYVPVAEHVQLALAGLE